MSLNLEISKNILKNEPKIHYIPAATNGNGSANVKNYFENYMKTDENGFLSNSLRGYPLKGSQFKLPNDYKGICFQETRKPLDEISERKLKAFGAFNEFIYWNYDKQPSNGDNLNQALQILDLADTLIEDISLDEIEKEINRKESNSR